MARFRFGVVAPLLAIGSAGCILAVDTADLAGSLVRADAASEAVDGEVFDDVEVANDTRLSDAATDSRDAAADSVVAKPRAKLSELADNFDTNRIDPMRWAAFSGVGYTTSATNQSLAIVNPATSSDWGGVMSVDSYDATSSQIVVRLESAGSATGAAVEPIVWVKLKQIATFGNAIEIGVSQNELYAKRFFGGGATILKTTPYSNTAMRWLRIREASGSVFWEYAAGQNGPWTFLHSETEMGDVTRVQLELGAGAWPGAMGTVVFDDINPP